MVNILFIILGMFACSGIAIRLFKDLNRQNCPLPQIIWHAVEMLVLVVFLSFLMVG